MEYIVALWYFFLCAGQVFAEKFIKKNGEKSKQTNNRMVHVRGFGLCHI